MKVTKEGGKILFQVPNMTKGVEYNLDDYLFYSVATKKPYKHQIKIERLPSSFCKAFEDAFTSYHARQILGDTKASEADEAKGIAYLLGKRHPYYSSLNRTVEFRRFTIMLFQMLKSIEIDLSLDYLHSLAWSTPEKQRTHETSVQYVRFIKKYIEEYGVFILSPNELFTKVALQKLGELPGRISRIIIDLYVRGDITDIEKIKYIIRKEQSEGLSYIFTNEGRSLFWIIQNYFRLCENANVDWRQKNFIRTYAYVAQLAEAKKERLIDNLSKNFQSDKFRFNYNGFTSIIPKNQLEFVELGHDFHNCVSGYYDSAVAGRTVIVSFYKDDFPRICADIIVNEKGLQLNTFLRPLNQRGLTEEEEELKEAFEAHIRTIEF